VFEISILLTLYFTLYDSDKIILLGSYAWGEPDEDSDIDMYIEHQKKVK